MRFSKIFATFLLTIDTVAGINGQPFVDALKSITTMSGSLNTKIQTATGPLLTSEAITSGLRDIVTECYKDVATLGLGGGYRVSAHQRRQGKTVAESEQDAVCREEESLITVSRAMLQTVISKKRAVELAFLIPSIAAVLRQYESCMDLFLYEVLSVVPTCADGVSPKVQDFYATVQKAVDTYSPQ